LLHVCDDQTNRLHAYEVTHARLVIGVARYVESFEWSGEEMPEMD
jgi:hypothetical protein